MNLAFFYQATLNGLAILATYQVNVASNSQKIFTLQQKIANSIISTILWSVSKVKNILVTGVLS